MTTYTAYPVAASAYGIVGQLRYARESGAAAGSLSHIIARDGATARVLCTRVRLDSVLEDGSLAEAPETATCAQCVARYRREG